MTAALIVLFGGISAAYLVWRRLLAYLGYFQQEGYEPLRFLQWVSFRSLMDPGVWLAVVCRVMAGTGLPAMSTSTGGGSGAEVSVVEQAIGLGISVSSPPSRREIGAAILFALGAVGSRGSGPNIRCGVRPFDPPRAVPSEVEGRLQPDPGGPVATR